MNAPLSLTDQVDILREENRQLREIIARMAGGDDVANAIRVFRLSRRQATMFAMLLKRDADRWDLLNATHDLDRQARLGQPDWAVNTMIRHIRAKVRPFGIEIESVYGFGYRMDTEMRGRARKALAEAQQPCAL